MRRVESEPPEVYLLPGESHFSEGPMIIRTLLGSCVAATFWSPRRGAGALSHSLLPHYATSVAEASAVEGRRYVDFAIRELALRFDLLGVPRAEVQVKLFGGADVLPVPGLQSTRLTVGEQNCRAALAVVSAEGLNLISSSLRGNVGYDVRLDTRTGEVHIRRLMSAMGERPIVHPRTNHAAGARSAAGTPIIFPVFTRARPGRRR